MATGFVLPNPRFQAFVHGTNQPLSGGQIYFYLTGTLTLQTVFSDINCTIPLPNPVSLDSNGEPVTGSGAPTCIYGNAIYDIQIFDSSSVLQDSSLKGISFSPTTSGGGGLSNEWLAQAGTPVYISPSSFTMTGNQTSVFTTGRRIKATVTSGIVYGTVITSSYGAGSTTITVESENGTLDSGLSSVSVGILNASNTSIPILAPATTLVGTSSAYAFTGQDIPSLPGSTFKALIGITNIGTSTISINGSAPAIMYKWGTVPLEAGDLVTGTYAIFFRGATTWQLMNPGIIDDARFETNSINADKLINASITDTQIASATITGDRLVNSTITSTQTDNSVAPVMNASGGILGRSHEVVGQGTISNFTDPFGHSVYGFLITLSGAAVFTGAATYGVTASWNNTGFTTHVIDWVPIVTQISGTQFVVYGDSNSNGLVINWSGIGY